MLRPQLCGTNVKHTLWRPKVMVLPRADVQIARKSSAMPSEHPVPYERVSAKRKSKADGVQHKVDGPSIRGATHLSFSIATARPAGGESATRPPIRSLQYPLALSFYSADPRPIQRCKRIAGSAFGGIAGNAPGGVAHRHRWAFVAPEHSSVFACR